MQKAKLTNNHTADIAPNHSTMFALLLELNVVCVQKWIQFELQNSPNTIFAFDGKIHTISKPVKSDHNSVFWYFQNNHIKTTNIFSVRSSPDPPIVKKIVVRSSPDPAKIGFGPDPVRSSPDPCSSLTDSELGVARLNLLFCFIFMASKISCTSCKRRTTTRRNKRNKGLCQATPGSFSVGLLFKRAFRPLAFRS